MFNLNQVGNLHQLFGGCASFFCFDDAVYYDANGKGYCLAHAPGELVDDEDE